MPYHSVMDVHCEQGDDKTAIGWSDVEYEHAVCNGMQWHDEEENENRR